MRGRRGARGLEPALDPFEQSLGRKPAVKEWRLTNTRHSSSLHRCSSAVGIVSTPKGPCPFSAPADCCDEVDEQQGQRKAYGARSAGGCGWWAVGGTCFESVKVLKRFVRLGTAGGCRRVDRTRSRRRYGSQAPGLIAGNPPLPLQHSSARKPSKQSSGLAWDCGT